MSMNEPAARHELRRLLRHTVPFAEDDILDAVLDLFDVRLFEVEDRTGPRPARYHTMAVALRTRYERIEERRGYHEERGRVR